MTSEVEGDDAMALREMRHLVVPKVTIAGPTVDEHQGRLAVTFDVIVDGHSIPRVSRSVSVRHKEKKKERIDRITGFTGLSVSCSSCQSRLIPFFFGNGMREHFAFFDELGDLAGDHFFPRGIAALDLFYDIGREDR